MKEYDRAPLPDELAIQSDDKERMLKAIDSLPDELRMTVILYYYQQMSRKEIAEATGVSESLVGVRMHRARSIMKRKLTASGTKNRVLAAAPLPFLFGAISEEAEMLITPQMSTFLREGVRQTLRQLPPLASTEAVGAMKSTSSMSGGSTATVVTKVTLGVLAVSVAAGGAYYVAGISRESDPQSSSPASYRIEEEIPMISYDTERSMEPVFSDNPSSAESISSEILSDPPPSAAESTAESTANSTPASSERSIETLSDMIGQEDAHWLSGYASNRREDEYEALTALIGRHNMHLTVRLEKGEEEVYLLYTLEKQNKRLSLLIKTNETALGGAAYQLGERQEPIPKAYQLTSLYESWQTFP